MKSFIILFIILGLMSCGEKSYTFMADPMLNLYKNEMKEKRNYSVEGIGGSIPNLDVQSLFISFVGKYEVDVRGARRLYVEAVECLIKKINDDKSLRPYLHNYPATYQNVKVLLGFTNINNEPVDQNYVAYITCIKEMVHYTKFNIETRNFEKIWQEPYEDALRIVKEE